jgi:hypothetical protein
MKRIQRISRKVNRNRQVHQQQQQPSLLASNKLGRLEMKYHVSKENKDKRNVQKNGKKERVIKNQIKKRGKCNKN